MKELLETIPYLWDHYGSWGLVIVLVLVELKFSPIRKLYKSLDILDKVETELVNLKTLVTTELTHNGGSSLKDALRRTEQLVQRLAAQAHVGMELHPYGIFMCDMEGKNFYVNRTYANELECTKEELIDGGWENFLASEDYKWRDAFDRKKDLSTRLLFRKKSGEVVSCTLIATLLDGTNGYMGYIIFD